MFLKSLSSYKYRMFKSLHVYMTIFDGKKKKNNSNRVKQ